MVARPPLHHPHTRPAHSRAGAANAFAGIFLRAVGIELIGMRRLTLRSRRLGPRSASGAMRPTGRLSSSPAATPARADGTQPSRACRLLGRSVLHPRPGYRSHLDPSALLSKRDVFPFSFEKKFN